MTNSGEINVQCIAALNNCHIYCTYWILTQGSCEFIFFFGAYPAHFLFLFPNGPNVFCFLSSLPTPPPTQLARQCLVPTPVIFLLLANTVSSVRACLSILLDRFRGTQKEDECRPLSIQSSLLFPIFLTIKTLLMLGFIFLLSTVPELVLNLCVWVNKFLSALEMECWASSNLGRSAVQQPGALTTEPCRTLSNKI